MAETTDNRTRGILWMLATMVCFLTLDTIMKYGMETYSVLEVSWARFTFATLFAALLAGRSLPRISRARAVGMHARMVGHTQASDVRPCTARTATHSWSTV